MASRYISTTNKEQAHASYSWDKPCKRIKTPTFNTSALIMKNQLTFIGRTTNPSEQSVSALILALPRQWTLKKKVTGSDLGQNSFQFWLELEEDLNSVLAAQPYHYTHWMVILQRWKPVISASFSSQIPFWISLHSLPLHYWDEKVLYNIGQDLGTLETYNITKTSTEIRMFVDALKPLTKETLLEFDKEKNSWLLSNMMVLRTIAPLQQLNSLERCLPRQSIKAWTRDCWGDENFKE